MKFLPIILVLFLVTATQTYGKSLLSRLSRDDFDNRIQIFAYFNDLPDFKQRLSNKRLDLTLIDTVISRDIPPLPTDGRIVKTLLTPQQDDTNLSLFFRYAPQDIRVSRAEADTIVIDIIPGNRFTGTYNELADTLGTVFVVNRDKPYPVNPLDQSPYSTDWLSFFTAYQAYAPLTPPLSVFIPSFPWTALTGNGKTEFTGYPATLAGTIENRDWLGSLVLVQRALKDHPQDSEKQYLALLHAEILFRLGNVNIASDQLRLIRNTYQHEPIGMVAQYIHFLIEARKGNYNLAQIGIKRLTQTVPEDHPLQPYMHLSLVETGLALQQTDYVAELLAQTPPGNETIKRRLSIRTADAYRAEKKYAEALQQYTTVEQESDFYLLPFTLNGYCITLVENQQDEQGATCYQTLSDLLADQEQKGAAHYRAIVADYNQSSYGQMNVLLDQIISQYPHTDAALRAEMKKADICVAHDSRCFDTAIDIFDRLAHTMKNREICGEAWFKKALLLHLNGNDHACIGELMSWMRSFQSSGIRLHVQALLIETLPAVINNLLSEGNDADAVILAQQTRELFDNRWIDPSILFNLVSAFERLGLYREAIELLLFLRNEYNLSDQQEIYLSLTRLAHLRGNNHLVDDFSSQYFYQFPDGPFHDDVLYYRIDSTYASGRIDEAEALLPASLPERTDFKLLAASIFFQQDAYEKTAELLMPLNKGLFSDSHIFMLAESLYELGRFDEATRFFALLENAPDYRDIALYRTGQPEPNGTTSPVDIYQLREIARSSTDSQWRRFATQKLRYVKMMEML